MLRIVIEQDRLCMCDSQWPTAHGPVSETQGLGRNPTSRSFFGPVSLTSQSRVVAPNVGPKTAIIGLTRIVPNRYNHQGACTHTQGHSTGSGKIQLHYFTGFIRVKDINYSTYIHCVKKLSSLQKRSL